MRKLLYNYYILQVPCIVGLIWVVLLGLRYHALRHLYQDRFQQHEQFTLWCAEGNYKVCILCTDQGLCVSFLAKAVLLQHTADYSMYLSLVMIHMAFFEE